ncbi:hypothetical protein BDV96DRAFT_101420 [Lophiotrema nucula]|uniref:NAD(P)-binding domain-containing protein n=1 Tax=Lophiotrema nucula TaxID=690887 RepID=A0A6A5Z626_9PLEO|nr:hypothetical protein BDV96DRAFT_101420 [Lophiotrema nucula]
MAPFKSVAVAGKGQLGNFVVSELVNAGFQVTILTRSSSKLEDVPAGVNAAEVDYDSVSSIADALRGHDVLIATLAMDAISVQYNLLNAAIEAGVKRFIPSEYSGITLHPTTASLPPLAPVMDVQKAVKLAAEEGKIEYTIIAPGGFLNLMFNQPILLDWEHHVVYLYDGGDSKVSVSRLSTIAKAIRAVLEKGDEYKNKTVKVHDGTVTQRQLLAIAREEQPGVAWNETFVDVDAMVEDALKKLAEGQGTPEIVGGMMVGKSMSKVEPLAWSENELENARLGLRVN